MENAEKLFIIDGTALMYRAFHAIPATFTNSKGLHTNAVYGFTQSLKKILKDFSPHYMAVAFDVKGPTLRHGIYEDYKAERPPMPDLLSAQIPLIKAVVRALNIKVLEKESFEADDIIAAVVKKARGRGIKSYIISGDKDLLQLVDDNTVVLDYLSGKEHGRAEVEKKFGVGPNMIKELIGLAGDPVDNIPNVPGVGIKTAAKLISRYGTLENLFEHIDEVQGKKLRENLIKHKAQAFLSRDLATLRDDVDMDIVIETLKVGEPDYKRLTELFKELEFVKMLKEVMSRDYEPPGSGDFSTVNTTEGLKRLSAELESKKRAAIAAFFPEGARRGGPVALAVATGESTAAYIASGGESGPDEGDVTKFLKDILENGSIKKDVDSSKPLYIYSLTRGIRPLAIDIDTSLASYVINPSKPDHTIEGLTVEHLGRLSGNGAPEDASTQNIACEKACNIYELSEKLDKILKDESMEKLYREMELPLSEVLASMEIWGIKIDSGQLQELSSELGARLETIRTSIYRCAGVEFNINSPKQLSKVLFERLGLIPVKRTKTGFSTNEEVLTKLSAVHEVPAQILEYRTLFKLKSTYVDALLSLIDAETGRIHTSFNQTVTATGRLSSSNPNLQNIPVRGETGGRIREAFVAEDGFTLLSADYSQIELRIVAHMAEDPVLLEAFRTGEDIHARTASEIFGLKDVSAVTPELRRRAKAINFGIIYGMGPYGLSTELGIPIEEAGAYIDDYFTHYTKVREFLDRTVKEAERLGYTTTLSGRRRFIPELSSPVEMTRRFGARIAVNTPVQGSAADIIKAAMINIYRRMKESGFTSRMILQIHDELLFEVEKTEARELAALVKEEMEGVVSLKVPIEVNLKTGANWQQVEPYNE
ncbi:MAG: DNA polymerase I [Thermodesulfobacteriota bacterium]|nr:MAG: DNA polymerase I [Thermodesulfobacteriota bacterium]